MTVDDTLIASFEALEPSTAEAGQLAHPLTIEHSARLKRKLYETGKNAWCMVGNGLSNQSFVEGPDGLIVIDTGECIEEMQSALEEVRKITPAPIAACIYTHFHYVSGTSALFSEQEAEEGTVEIYGHSGIAGNRERYGGEVSARTTRGIVHQFGLMLPADGEDGLVNVGLGQFFRNPDHKPFTPGYLPATVTFDSATKLTIAGLRVEITPAPSDADDSITIWFPELKLCINNLVWPTLFNVFAIRGEEYRDPRILLTGLDHLLTLDADYLLGTHGPPVMGREEVTNVVTDYRDSIQFLWDQTVRGVNKGLFLDELTSFVQLPQRFNRTYFTQQFYGLVEHHVKQIHAGLFGWFDEDETNLFPLPPTERARRLIEGFGGRDNVRKVVDEAIETNDLRWAVELAGWLVKSEKIQEDRERLAAALRKVAQRTTAANLRNWCLTRCLELEGKLNLDRFRTHRFNVDEVMAAKAVTYVPILRVLLDPNKAEGVDNELRWEFEDGSSTGLKIRGQVAIPTSGVDADLAIKLNQETWAKLLCGKTTLTELIDSKLIAITGDVLTLKRFLASFDVSSFI